MHIHLTDKDLANTACRNNFECKTFKNRPGSYAEKIRRSNLVHQQ